jgi:hypothetical protein
VGTPPPRASCIEEEGPYWRVRWWYSVVVSISGCDPLDPGSNPGTAILFVLFSFVFVFVLLAQNFRFPLDSVPCDRGAHFPLRKTSAIDLRTKADCSGDDEKKKCCIRWDSNPRPQSGLRPERSALTARPRMRRWRGVQVRPTTCATKEQQQKKRKQKWSQRGLNP